MMNVEDNKRIKHTVIVACLLHVDVAFFLQNVPYFLYALNDIFIGNNISNRNFDSRPH